MRSAVRFLAALAAAWLLLELGVRAWVGWPLPTDFYGSIPRNEVREWQRRYGLQTARGPGWAHLGWIADPEGEEYRIERATAAGWEMAGRTRFGSFLLRTPGRYRVRAQAADGAERDLGDVTVDVAGEPPPVHVPRIAGPWQVLFRPTRAGEYVNDHTVFRDGAGNWRVVGITGPGRGDYARERRFAVGVAAEFPPPEPMREVDPIADFGALAWAPHVIAARGAYHMFWSPHRLHHMRSADGVHWEEPRITMAAPFHRFFRDAMILEVADGQWLLYATARGAYFSRVDLYQSFDLEGWQYIGGALRTGWGSERNGIVASTESPFVVRHAGRYYLTVTYNNDSFFLPALLLPLRIWLDRPSYNDTLVFHSDNPYDFGAYRGRGAAPTLAGRLSAHAPEIVHDAGRDAWYVTTAGWPWVATLTTGEVAVAPLAWEAEAR